MNAAQTYEVLNEIMRGDHASNSRDFGRGMAHAARLINEAMQHGDAAAFLDELPRGAWRRYENDPDALLGVLLNNSIEIARARSFIEWATVENVEINNHLYERRQA